MKEASLIDKQLRDDAESEYFDDDYVSSTEKKVQNFTILGGNSLNNANGLYT